MRQVLVYIEKIIKRKSTPEYFWKLRNKALNKKFKLAKYYYAYMYSKFMEKYCCSIPLSTIIIGKPSFPHGLNGIFISQGAVIGKNCVIFHQVTIGSNTLKDHKKIGAPILGDNVYIGSGAKIIGKIKIGSNVRIGANAVVVKDIDDNCTVVLNAPRILIHNENKDNTWYDYNSIIK